MDSESVVDFMPWIFHDSAVVGTAVNLAPTTGEFFLAACCVVTVLPYTDIRRLGDVRPVQGVIFQRDVVMSHARAGGVVMPVSGSCVTIGIRIVSRTPAMRVHFESAI